MVSVMHFTKSVEELRVHYLTLYISLSYIALNSLASHFVKSIRRNTFTGGILQIEFS
ncbi:hypothetical protein BKA69DRAFT_340913 [Paraphysoderma sedebokerense]|nr:hypothetical protein BKA69DRAFT_340913 [Paraphysoderma sedebokerense]